MNLVDLHSDHSEQENNTNFNAEIRIKCTHDDGVCPNLPDMTEYNARVSYVEDNEQVDEERTRIDLEIDDDENLQQLTDKIHEMICVRIIRSKIIK